MYGGGRCDVGVFTGSFLLLFVVFLRFLKLAP